MIYAVNISQQLIDARCANRHLVYWCPHCMERLYLRIGTKRIPHFAHFKSRDTYCGKGEGIAHYLLKYKIFDYFKAQGYQVDVEPFIKSAIQYPDIVIDGKYAIEIQFSNIKRELVQNRTKGLVNNGLEVTWIILNPHYNESTKQLLLTRYQCTFINPHNRTMVVWDCQKLKLFQYYNIQFLGGKSFWAERTEISPRDIILKKDITDNIKLFKLSYDKVSRFIKRCQYRHSVLEPTLSVIYNLRLQIDEICRYFGFIFNEQLFIYSHPIYWQLQLYYLIQTDNYNLEKFMQLLEFNTFYLDEMNHKEIVQSIVEKFKLYYCKSNCNNVQKRR